MAGIQMSIIGRFTWRCQSPKNVSSWQLGQEEEKEQPPMRALCLNFLVAIVRGWGRGWGRG